jgi:pyruvate dehydrogenase E2 component (dihydrolipoamide acetyltransferase)
VLLKILYPEGQEVEVLTPIAYIGQPGERIEDGGQKAEDIAPKAEDAVPESAIRNPQPAIGERMAVSPSARRLAQEKGIKLEAVQGTGPGGRITKEDILAAARNMPVRAYEETPHGVTTSSTGTAQTATPDDTVVVFSPMRARIAERLTRSKQVIPHFYISIEVDMSEAVTWRQRFNESRQTRVTVTDMIVKAVAIALSQYTRMNAHVEQDRIILKRP